VKKELDERLYKYSLDIIKLSDHLSKDISGQTIARQLVRSGTSVTANIKEAKAASSKKDYVNFYHYALKSANETELWLSLATDSGKVDRKKAEKLFKETREIAKILAASIITMKKNI